MIPVKFDQANLELKKPSNMTDEECGPLPVKVHSGGPYVAMTSCWRPTAEDIAAINEGKPVWLTVLSARHPPVILSTEMPFNELPPET